ncbi:MAG TPA: SHOCT domain-containing protein [Gemmataceae bacterium]|nr:SHOCT domain-containing protein [Gemmataceae bacterium]
MALPWLATELALRHFAGLLAQTTEPRRGRSISSDDWLGLWWHYVVLLGVALVAVLAVYGFMRWWRRKGPDRLSASEQLSQFRKLYEQGQLSQEEFERLRALLGERMKREMEGQSSVPDQRVGPASPPQPAPSPPPDAPRPPGPG